MDGLRPTNITLATMARRVSIATRLGRSATMPAMLALLVGCGGSLYEVATPSGDPAPGIPFVRKKEVLDIEAEYHQPWYRISLEVTTQDAETRDTERAAYLKAVANGKSPPKFPPRDTYKSVTVRYTENAGCASYLAAKFGEQQAAAGAVDAIRDHLGTTTPTPGGACKAGMITLTEPGVFARQATATAKSPFPSQPVRVTRRRRTVVDRENVFFFNVERESVGTTTAAITLNPDGTLLTINGTVENKAAEVVTNGITSALGTVGSVLGGDVLSTLITTKAGTDDDKKPVASDPLFTTGATLKVEPFVRVYLLKDTYDSAHNDALPKFDESASVTISVRKASAPPSPRSPATASFSTAPLRLPQRRNRSSSSAAHATSRPRSAVQDGHVSRSLASS